jgi:hypothetical protein
LEAEAGSIVVTPHCGLEVLDVVEFTDDYVSPSAIKRRVRAIGWRFDRVRGVYEQRIELGAM